MSYLSPDQSDLIYFNFSDGKHDPISEPIIFVTESELQYSVDCIHKVRIHKQGNISAVILSIQII